MRISLAIQFKECKIINLRQKFHGNRASIESLHSVFNKLLCCSLSNQTLNFKIYKIQQNVT